MQVFFCISPMFFFFLIEIIASYNIDTNRILRIAELSNYKHLSSSKTFSVNLSTRDRESQDGVDLSYSSFSETFSFLAKSALVGTFTGCGVVIFKSSIASFSSLLYENFADLLPKPAFYWPLALYPIIGSIIVAILSYISGPSIRNGADFIAQTIDSIDEDEIPIFDIENVRSKYIINSTIINDITYSPNSKNNQILDIMIVESSDKLAGFVNMNNSMSVDSTDIFIDSIPKQQLLDENPSILAKQIINRAQKFDPISFLYRILAAISTLGSGCSLGPEGPAVEIGTGISRLISSGKSKANMSSTREKHQLFLCGASAAVSAGFNAPITGVFFAIECGNRYLQKNTIKLDENSPDGPRADIAAIVLSATIANLLVQVGLHEAEALSVQGNIYALNSPIFELTLYVGLGLLSGGISVVFTKLREVFAELYNGTSEWSKKLPFSNIPFYLRPILAGIACGLVSLYFPQTLFVGYTTLDQLLAGKIKLAVPLLLELLGLKIILSSFSLSSGLIGGVFAPSLFFGAAIGTAYHNFMNSLILNVIAYNIINNMVDNSFNPFHSLINWLISSSFFTIASAPAYATVGAAATLGSLFRAPLTSSMLMFELTQNHDIVLPVLLSTGLGGLFAELISHPRKQW